MDANQVTDSILRSMQMRNDLEYLQGIIHDTAKEHGWWSDDCTRNKGESIALMHSELSEGLEALRYGNPVSDHIPPFKLIEEELADTIVRILDFSAGFGYDTIGALIAKMEFNKTRPHKHGGKEF